MTMMRRGAQVSIPFGRGHIDVTVPSHAVVASPRPWPRIAEDGTALVVRALEAPIASPRLADLARGMSHLVVITSDHTRAVPSRVTLPVLFAEARRYRPDLRITLLIGTGLHRAPSARELEEQLGGDVLSTCHLAIHDATRAESLADLGELSTGSRLLVNRLLVEADLVVAEGLIEPHLFAGYSGGRKSILPAVAGAESIFRNHRPEFIDHPRARNGVMDGNPVHEEMVEAARRAGLKFILNIIVAASGAPAAAVAGEPGAAHRAGVARLQDLARCEVEPAEIVLVSNSGYPLDRDLYQCIKGLAVAADAAVTGATIVLIAECVDGIGHQDFCRLASMKIGPSGILQAIRQGVVPPRDGWQVQILARILERHRVVVVSPNLDAHDIREMHMEWAPDVETALAGAYAHHGVDAGVIVIPEGPATVIVPQKSGVPKVV